MKLSELIHDLQISLKFDGDAEVIFKDENDDNPVFYELLSVYKDKTAKEVVRYEFCTILEEAEL